MDTAINLLGWGCAIVGGIGLLACLAWFAMDLWWRVIKGGMCLNDLREAAEEWRDKHPEKVKRFDRRWDGA